MTFKSCPPIMNGGYAYKLKYYRFLIKEIERWLSFWSTCLVSKRTWIWSLNSHKKLVLITWDCNPTTEKMGPLDSLASQFSLYCVAQHYKRSWLKRTRWRTPEETEPKLICWSTHACYILNIPRLSGLPQDGNGLAWKNSCAMLLFLLGLYVNSQQSLLKTLFRRY